MGKYLVLNSDREVVTQLIMGVHQIPDGALLIDDARWYEVTQDVTCTWKVDEAGELVKLPKGEIVDDDLSRDVEREWRNQVLASTEWLVARHRDELETERPTTLTAEQYKQLQDYRRGLRDWPELAGFPLTENRPVAPEWLLSVLEK